MEIRLWVNVLSLFLVGGLTSCVNETNTGTRQPISQELIWYSKYICQDGFLTGIYRGELSLSRLTPGENLKVFFGDSLISDTSIALDGIANFDFKTSEIHIRNVKVVYRGDTLIMVSEDSLYASVNDESYHPFPIYFSVSHGSGGGSIGFSLLKSDSTRNSLRCIGFIENIIPDTLKVKDGDIWINLTGDIYGNYYDIYVDHIDSAGEYRSILKHELKYSYNQSPSRNQLRRGSHQFHTYIPVFPADLTLSFGFSLYHIRIEKK